MGINVEQHRSSRMSSLVSAHRVHLMSFFILLSILGAWLNAQGGWVKDFSYQRVVVLPFLFNNYTTSGFDWYLAGVFDDLLGLSANLIGIYGFKRLAKIREIDLYRRKYFLIALVAYLVADLVAFVNFQNYYSGRTSLSLYGIYWNMIQYFAMLPAFVLADSFLLLYKTK